MLAGQPLASKVDLPKEKEASKVKIEKKENGDHTIPDDSPEVEKFLQQKKQKENLQLWQQFQESNGRRFETLFFISFPFSLILTFGSVQLYGLTMAGNSVFQMKSAHIASVILGSSFISLAVAYKGYINYKQRKEELRRRIFGYDNSANYEDGLSGGGPIYLGTCPGVVEKENFALRIILASMVF